jgi:hypothetical protein
VAWQVNFPWRPWRRAIATTAEAAGDVTITRVPENDFKCPIQPSKGDILPE